MFLPTDMFTRERRMRASAATFFAVALLASGATFPQGCRTVTGPISPLVPSTCPGCFEGTFSGDLTGTFSSQLTSLTPGPGGTLAFTALSSLNVKAPPGTIQTIDAGTASGCQFSPTGEFLCQQSKETLQIVGGTGLFTRASGEIVLTGGYLAGQPGTYSGQICFGGRPSGS